MPGLPDVPSLLFALAAVLGIWQLLAWAARAMRQPVVILEIVGGILVGPTLWRGQMAVVLLPADIRPFLDAFADVGLVMLMFMVGLGFDRRVLRHERRSIGVIGAGSLLVPACLGALLAVTLVGRHAHGRPASSWCSWLPRWP